MVDNFFLDIFGSIGRGWTVLSSSRPTEHWNSKIGVVCAVMGTAIGLGNFIRFPGLASQYGGGSFIIPYVIAILLLGLPIAWVEWTMGRMGGKHGFHSTPGIFQVLWKGRFSAYTGILGLLIPVGIFMYYVLIESWCLYYAYQYLVGGITLGGNSADYKSFFESFTGSEKDGILLASFANPAIWTVFICYFLNFLIIYRGINKGIETVVRASVPLLFVCAFLVLIRVLTLGTPDPSQPERSLVNGLGAMWNPVQGGKSMWDTLLNPETWLVASGHVFFSLSVGFGVIINYSSYLRAKDDVLLSGTTASSGNIFAEIALGGMITVPAAFIFLGSDSISSSTFSLGFITLPNVFSRMVLGQLVGFVWFFLLFIAALTSSISMLQPAVAFFEEGLKFSKKKAILVLSILTLGGTGFIMYFSKDSIALETMDFWLGTAGIYVLATITVVMFGWVIGAKEGLEEARRGSLMRVPNFFAFILKYVSPVYLLVILLFWAFRNLPSYWEQIRNQPVVMYTISFILFLVVFFGILIGIAKKHWIEKVEENK